MAKIVKPLSQTQIQSAKPKDKMYKLSDGEGLALWVYPTARKVWRFDYTRKDGKRDTITIGKYPEIGLGDARRKKEGFRSDLALGVDPKACSSDDFLGFEDVAMQWWERRKTRLTDRYANEILSNMRMNLFRHLKKDIREIKSIDIVKALSKIEDRGSLTMLSRVKQNAKSVYDFAVSRGICEYNPVTNINNDAFTRTQKTNFRALPPEGLPSLVSALDSGTENIITTSCIYIQLLTMVRPSEALKMTWQEIDFDEGVWIIPPERMKKRREHVVPLSSQAIKMLSDIREMGLSDHWVFPSRKSHLYRDAPRQALARLNVDTTAHGLRALASTTLNESGLFRTDVIEAALAHTDSNSVRAAYNRAEYFEEKKAMLQWWADLIYSHK